MVGFSDGKKATVDSLGCLPRTASGQTTTELLLVTHFEVHSSVFWLLGKVFYLGLDRYMGLTFIFLNVQSEGDLN